MVQEPSVDNLFSSKADKLFATVQAHSLDSDYLVLIWRAIFVYLWHFMQTVQDVIVFTVSGLIFPLQNS